ncbi:carboxypeptidase-like regulatory domain-containing protein [Planctomicrobium sp. SH661]|uniref:carboxypeptidase-like regulatory domain-containing protein n=1 Tax=Planctomicrobium sp. SH661 TaxID=3448124 RepID=UPI003F5B3F21
MELLTQRSSLWLVLAMLSSLATGCGKKPIPGRPALYPVTGVVSFAGEPSADAVVVFSPVDHSFAATAKTREDGSFEMQTFSPSDGAAAGEYKVLVYKVDVHELPGGGIREVYHLPDRYRDLTKTDLVATVSPDQKNQLNFTLSK